MKNNSGYSKNRFFNKSFRYKFKSLFYIIIFALLITELIEGDSFYYFLSICNKYIYLLVCLIVLIIKLKSRRGMHFVKFHTVSQMQNNVELISEILSRPHPRTKDQKSQSESPPLHSRTQSSYYSPQHAFSINLEAPAQPNPINYLPQRTGVKNPETPTVKRPQVEPHGKGSGKEFFGIKLRKSSENNMTNEHQQIEAEKHDLFLSNDLNGYLRSPKNGLKAKERKASCNLDLTTFFKKGRKDSENNSGPEKVVKRETQLTKKRSMGWDENNNFQFSSNLNSDEAQRTQQTGNLMEIPKIQNIRKQSHNDSPKKQVPSFLNSFKNHKNSLDTVQLSKKGKFSIENFIIIRQLGKGTFGRVILAVQRQSRLIFAIKIISKREIRESNMIEQLIRQLKIQQGINHPNVIKVYGFFDDLLHFYTIMECALDSHLSETIKKRPTPYTEVEAATIMSQVCQVIAHLHSESIIHRDLKPDNILFHQGVVKITDFGWSVRRDGRLRSTFCGTPVYLCPQILIGDEYDQSVDIWTVGVILYEIIYRSNPFRITCKEELINILNQPIHFDERVQISDAAKDFIQLCLRKRAAERPNIRELQLHQFLFKAVSFQEQKR